MKTIQLNLYPVSELEGKAKENAIENYRYINIEHFTWWDYIYDDFKEKCEAIGIDVEAKSIYFRGFYSQGDGSMFKADINLDRLFNAFCQADLIEKYQRADIELPDLQVDHRVTGLIRDDLLDVTAIITHQNRAYYVSAEISVGYAFTPEKHPLITEQLDKLEKWLKAVAETLNRYLYRTLQIAYEYEIEDDAVIMAIEANEYWFTADGEKANRLAGLNFNQSLKSMP